ncbi:hypothetical protein E1293_01190 [Actinomadura darangshiensis]|uniref:Uncharacterized protein n=1 Tax=Actinomadura darangshiensis TaxID=705336 RepID=A0A4R5C1J4_9ACTN|nr:hypothetical protein [Actinomadura darangshiensis]TDD92156.1 hypothetical protein E1293_01190 [Actinomadura darangshiensis]
MTQKNPHALTYAELDRLSGEVLPGRLLLSAAGHGSDTDVVYACQYDHDAGTTGLLGTGLLAEPERTSMVCIPVVVHHDA